MALIPEIDELLAKDEANVRSTRELFADFSQDLPEAINQSAVLYTTALRSFGQGFSDPWRPLAEIMKVHGLSDLAEVECLACTDLEAERALGQFHSRESRGALLARIGVLNSLAMADFLRMRVTAPQAFVRVQCESLALMVLMVEDPSVACAWRNIRTDEEGFLFYRRYQPLVKERLRRLNLEFAYDQASSVAMHSRFAGLVLGLDVTTRVVGHELTQEIMVKAQEFDPDQPDLFIIFVLHTLRVQERILHGLRLAAPELTDPIFLNSRLPTFTRLVNALFATMLKRRPDLNAALR